jgi:hypothetical protein
MNISKPGAVARVALCSRRGSIRLIGDAMTDREWLAAYAAALRIEAPTDDDITRILSLAAEAAHASQRTAAPVACWLAARSGRSLDDALAVAELVAAAPGA